jgi:hypothetical protein
VNARDRRPVGGLKGNTKGRVVTGCIKFGVSAVSDLLERDDAHMRTELRAGGEWTSACRDNRSGQGCLTPMTHTNAAWCWGCACCCICICMPYITSYLICICHASRVSVFCVILCSVCCVLRVLLVLVRLQGTGTGQSARHRPLGLGYNCLRAACAACDLRSAISNL